MFEENRRTERRRKGKSDTRPTSEERVGDNGDGIVCECKKNLWRSRGLLPREVLFYLKGRGRLHGDLCIEKQFPRCSRFKSPTHIGCFDSVVSAIRLTDFGLHASRWRRDCLCYGTFVRSASYRSQLSLLIRIRDYWAARIRLPEAASRRSQGYDSVTVPYPRRFWVSTAFQTYLPMYTMYSYVPRIRYASRWKGSKNFPCVISPVLENIE